MPMAIADVAPLATFIHGKPTDPGRTFHMAILSEGFLFTEVVEFRIAAARFARALLSIPPFKRHRDRISITRIDCQSRRSSRVLQELKPPPPAFRNNTPFDAAFSLAVKRIVAGDEDAVMALILSMNAMPVFSAVGVIVNSTLFGGGSTGQVGWVTLDELGHRTFVHELGHAAFGLADEYAGLTQKADEATRVFQGPEPVNPNVTSRRTRAKIPWRDLINVTDAFLPSTKPSPPSGCVKQHPNRDNLPAGAIGLFEGADTKHCGVFRATEHCLMREHASPFCPVCERAVDARLGTGSVVPQPQLRAATEPFTHVVTVPRVGAPEACVLAAYDTLSGRLSVFALDEVPNQAPTLTPLASIVIEAGWTSLAATQSGNDPMLVVNRPTPGGPAIHRLNRQLLSGPFALGREFLGNSTLGFSHLTALRIDLVPHLLHYDRLDGAIALERMRQDGDGITSPLLVGSSRAGSVARFHPRLSSFAPVELDGSTFIVSLDATNGIVRISTINLRADGSVPAQLLTDVFTSNAQFFKDFSTHCAAISINRRPMIVTYSPVSGLGMLWRLRQGGVGLDVVDFFRLGRGAFTVGDVGLPALGDASQLSQLWFYNAALKSFVLRRFA